MRTLMDAEVTELVRLTPPQKTLREAAKCLRWYIRYRTERDLKSADFLEMLRITG
jgi:hypothetical protein